MYLAGERTFDIISKMRKSKIQITNSKHKSSGEGRLFLAGHDNIITGEIIGSVMSERVTRLEVIQRKQGVHQEILQIVTIVKAGLLSLPGRL